MPTTLPRVALAAATAVSALALTASFASAAPAPPKVFGTVGPGFTINLMQKGKRVTHLKPGTYAFVIADKSKIHNFELERTKGPEFERELTDVSWVGTKTVLVKLTKGTYKYFCDPHASTMRGSFTVS